MKYFVIPLVSVDLHLKELNPLRNSCQNKDTKRNRPGKKIRKTTTGSKYD